MKKTFIFYGLKLMMLLALSIPVLTSCGGGDDDEVGGGSSSGNSGGSGSESGGEGGGGNPDDPEVTISLTAANLTDDGYFDGLLYYKITSNSTQEVTVNKCEKTAINVVIPSNVEIEGKTYKCTSIIKEAFSKCSSLSSITIPSCLKEIGSWAFWGCYNLKNIYITNLTAWCNIKAGYSISYGYHLFLNGNEIKDLVIPSDVTSIGSYAFAKCIGLSSVKISDNVRTIDNNAFLECTGLTNIEFSNSQLEIGAYAFQKCSGITTANIPSNVISLGAYAFADCTGLTTVNISSSIKEIDYSVFENCTNLKSVSIQSGNMVSIGENAFSGCTNLDSFEIPSSVKSIGRSAFHGCESLPSIKIPDGVEIINESTFSGCTGLKSIDIPNSVTSIGASAFYGCSGLTSISIGNGVKEISRWAFENCNNLKAVHIKDLAAWCNILFSDNLLAYAHHLFLNGNEINNLVIPDGVTTINSYAFWGCEGITSIVIPKSITNIGMGVFKDCIGVKNIYCECSTPPSIYSDSFSGCYNANLIVPPGSLSAYTSEWIYNHQFKNITEGIRPGMDFQPISLSLKGVPYYVRIGSKLIDILASIKGIVEYGGGITKEVESKDLNFLDTPDLSSTGTKSIRVSYNKTYTGAISTQEVTTTMIFEVTNAFQIGATDNSTPFWGAHSDKIKVNAGETKVSNFINYTCGKNNWNNFYMVLTHKDNSEYAVVRADNYGWGQGYEGNTGLVANGTQGDWATWLAAMNGAKVETSVTNNGNGTADVKIVMIGNNGKKYYQDYLGILINSNDFYYHFTIDYCHLVFK